MICLRNVYCSLRQVLVIQSTRLLFLMETIPLMILMVWMWLRYGNGYGNISLTSMVVKKCCYCAIQIIDVPCQLIWFGTDSHRKIHTRTDKRQQLTRTKGILRVSSKTSHPRHPPCRPLLGSSWQLAAGMLYHIHKSNSLRFVTYQHQPNNQSRKKINPEPPTSVLISSSKGGGILHISSSLLFPPGVSGSGSPVCSFLRFLWLWLCW